MSTAFPDTPRRFGDWPMAAKSILAFWAAYAVTVVIRAFLGGDPQTVLINRAMTVAIGIAMTFLVYAAMSLFAAQSHWRHRAVVAFVSSLIAAAAMSGLLMALDRYQDKPQDEVHFVSAEGYQITERGMSTVVERPGKDSVTITWPRVDKLDPWLQFRIFADNLVIWYFFFVAWAAFYLAIVAQGRSHELRRRAIAAEAAAQAAQVRALRYQVNPHFLFNTLNSLSSLVLTGRNEKAEEMLLALSTFFRTSLSQDPSADVTLSEEIDLQRLYLDIEKVRFPSRLKVEIDIPPDLGNARLPALLLQPLVENAIKYGVSPTRHKVKLTIAARHLPGERLEISVTNSARPDGAAKRAKEAPAEGTGVGLANVSQRLTARFGAQAKCEFGPLDEGGYQVRLTLPLDRSNG